MLTLGILLLLPVSMFCLYLDLLLTSILIIDARGLILLPFIWTARYILATFVTSFFVGSSSRGFFSKYAMLFFDKANLLLGLLIVGPPVLSINLIIRGLTLRNLPEIAFLLIKFYELMGRNIYISSLAVTMLLETTRIAAQALGDRVLARP